MPRSQHHPTPEERDERVTEDEFEELVAAALKVDPRGISGKHRRAETDDADPPSEPDA